MRNSIIGIDIGGANTKVSSNDGNITELHYVPLWKNTVLPDVLQKIARKIEPNRVAVVMTGELADCFDNKHNGIRFIMDYVNNAFNCEVNFVNVDGQFINNSDNINHLAAANWAASARIIGNEIGNCIFVDMGSTTTDIIPIIDGKHKAQYTDFKRLLHDELLYTGLLRTNIATVVDKLDLKKGACRPSSELFATTADAYLMLGDISSDMYNCEPADNAGVEKNDALRRLARVVCSDLNEISIDDIEKIAQSVKEKQIFLIKEAISSVSKQYNLDKIVTAGIGEFIIKNAAEQLGLECLSVANIWGSDVSKVFPAYAAANIYNL
ncbi:hydantoinase/oxoprolinase family protein [Methanohalobium sp.]|uniref:hydantoinase/oxoprolinase family protein n=1 Tax=Methanohalobium sp. TaxID=2837493 RepID=UPI0025CDD42B|nr:hydantoinase/oxoprolinase family protein [Methanohalobium sp.]